MSNTVHPEAQRELEEAFAFYRDRGGAALARAFLNEFGRVAEMLVANPGFGTPAGSNRRTYPFRRFPYSLIYRPTVDGVRILVVGHQNRLPGYWLRRKLGIVAAIASARASETAAEFQIVFHAPGFCAIQAQH